VARGERGSRETKKAPSLAKSTRKKEGTTLCKHNGNELTWKKEIEVWVGGERDTAKKQEESVGRLIK